MAFYLAWILIQEIFLTILAWMLILLGSGIALQGFGALIDLDSWTASCGSD